MFIILFLLAIGAIAYFTAETTYLYYAYFLLYAVASFTQYGLAVSRVLGVPNFFPIVLRVMWIALPIASVYFIGWWSLLVFAMGIFTGAKIGYLALKTWAESGGPYADES